MRHPLKRLPPARAFGCIRLSAPMFFGRDRLA